MKILILDTYYPAFLESFYRRRIDLNCKSYIETKNCLMGECFGLADYYSKNLIPLQHTAEEIIINDRQLQDKWARERGIANPYRIFQNIPKIKNSLRLKWSEKVLEAQIKDFRPDVLYCQSLSTPSQEFLRRIKGSVKLVVGQIASPIKFDKEALGAFDLITTSFPHFVDKFKKIGIQSEYFKIGFEATILKKLAEEGLERDVVFVGGISKNHSGALQTFEYLSANSPIEFWGYGKENLPTESPIMAKHHGEAWGLDMYNILHKAKITINRHIDVADNFANNMRLYESTGVGTMLITDYKDNLDELFELGKEVEVYRTKEELLDKIKYYLTHDVERKKIAEAGQRRTLRNHTYEKRMIELSGILSKYL